MRNQIKLSQREASNLTGIKNHSFDGVVINSVTQHFPSGDYLFEVLEKPVNVILDSGFIFVGDIRNRDLLEAFHTSVQFPTLILKIVPFTLIPNYLPGK